MPFSIWRLRTVAGANVAGLILGTALFAMFLDAHAVHAAGARVLAHARPASAYLAVAGTAILWSASRHSS